jgi:hypothetical protein
MCEDQPLPLGPWYHSAKARALLSSIQQNGWKPDQYVNVTYGQAIYLAACNWYCTDPLLECWLDPTTVIAKFPTGDDVLRHVRSKLGRLIGRNPGPASNQRNIDIRDSFLNEGIQAIAFEEYSGVNVLAVYDASRIVRCSLVPASGVQCCFLLSTP